MTLSSILSRKALQKPARRLALYLLEEPIHKDELAALWKAADTAQGMTEAEMKARLDDVAKSTEDGAIEQACEKTVAEVARALLTAQVSAAAGGPLSDLQATWISNNITAHSARVRRARALWLEAAGLGDASDARIAEICLKSALKGETVADIEAEDPPPKDDPAPPTPDPDVGEDTPPTPPDTNPDPTPNTPTHPNDKEAPMTTDPTQMREAILTRFKFNLAGLPARLRREEAQKVYLDAVIQAVGLLGHDYDGTDADRADDKNAMLWSVATAGTLLLDGHYDPTDQRFFQQVQRAVAELSGSAVEGASVQIDGHGISMFAPDRETTQKITVFGKVADTLGFGRKNGKVFLQSLAAASRKMIDRYDDHGGDEEHMSSLASAAYADHVTSASGGGSGDGVANVELPPLHDPHGYNDEIEPDNIRAVSTIYVSYQLEFMIKACMRIVDLFTAGLLPIPASGGNVREIDNLAWDREDFLDEAARRSVQARVLGAPGGEIAFDQTPNADFNMLLMRVVSAVAEVEREQNIITHFDNAARGRRYQLTSSEFVRKAVRDFAANASLRGWAGTAFTAERLAKQIQRVMKVLNLPAVKTAFGVSTPWQVVERVSQREFGITVNTVLHRTLAVETQNIMTIIADNHTIWSGSGTGRPLFSMSPENEGELSFDHTNALFVACQHFRAVTGLGDAQMAEFSEPEGALAVPSLPDIGGIGGLGGGAGSGGGMGGLNMEAIDQLRQLANSGTAPNPDQVMALLRTIN